MRTPPFSFGVVMLAAGVSRRMGQPKLLLPWGSTTIVGHLIAQWRALGARQIGPVCRPEDEPLIAELSRFGLPAADCILNPDAESGMFSSIQSAAVWTHWKPELSHFVIALGDQPQIQTGTLAALLRFAQEHPISISQPSFQGRPKHPVILPAQIFRAIAKTSASTLREFLDTYTAHRRFLESIDDALTFDLDSPQDYAAVRQRFAPSEE